MSANKFAGAIKVPANRVTAILKMQRGITADTALRLHKFFGTSAEFWMNLQEMYELDVARLNLAKDIETIPTCAEFLSACA